jgi:hypothetical protein
MMNKSVHSILLFVWLLPLFGRADQFDTLRIYWQNYLISNGGSASSAVSMGERLLEFDEYKSPAHLPVERFAVQFDFGKYRSHLPAPASHGACVGDAGKFAAKQHQSRKHHRERTRLDERERLASRQ